LIQQHLISFWFFEKPIKNWLSVRLDSAEFYFILVLRKAHKELLSDRLDSAAFYFILVLSKAHFLDMLSLIA